MRQLAMVIDLNKCIGCQTCTMACKVQWTNRNGREYMYWNNVETRPGKGYPDNWIDYDAGWDNSGKLKLGELPQIEEYGTPWNFNYEELADKGLLSPDKETQRGPNWDEDVGEGEYPNSYYFYLPRICNHCSNPACLAACPVKAIRKREEDGVVLVDQKICVGHMQCIRACPYKKVYFNQKIGKAEKCIMCFPRAEKGLPPACAKQCVGRIRHVGFIDDKDSSVYKLIKKYRIALPLRPDFGTKPNVYYIPPLSPPKFDEEGKVTDQPRIPISYLRELFGPNVDKSLEILSSEMHKKAKGEKSELIDLLIAFRHQDMFKL